MPSQRAFTCLGQSLRRRADGRADAGDERPRGDPRCCATVLQARDLPIIALTAAALVSERQAAMEAGMDDFLTKPIDADRLRETLTRWVAHSAPPATPEAQGQNQASRHGTGSAGPSADGPLGG